MPQPKTDDFPYKCMFARPSVKEAATDMLIALRKHNTASRIRTLDSEEYAETAHVNMKKINCPGKPRFPEITIVNKPKDYAAFETLSDLFNERARMMCKVKGYSTPHEFFTAHAAELRARAEEAVGSGSGAAHRQIIEERLREEIYLDPRCKECTSHKPQVALSVIDDARTVLDFSAGWGDRLAAALAAGVDLYCGIDPNPAVHEGYSRMVSALQRLAPNTRVAMVQDTAQAALAPPPGEGPVPHPEGGYDLVYTSPPYFDLEVYSGAPAPGSAARAWFEAFLRPALEGAWKRVAPGGRMAININNKRGGRPGYVEWMVDLVDAFPGAQRAALIKYYGLDPADLEGSKRRQKDAQPIWSWRKDA